MGDVGVLAGIGSVCVAVPLIIILVVLLSGNGANDDDVNDDDDDGGDGSKFADYGVAAMDIIFAFSTLALCPRCFIFVVTPIVALL